MIHIPNIAFEVTTDCNLHCAYCYNHWKCDDTFLRLNSYNKALKVLKRLFKIADIKQITFTGGEPFLSERFTELVLFSRLHNKNVAIINNGNVGTANDYKDLLSMGVSLFQIPFLSDKRNIHDKLTGIAGSWDKAMNSINELLHMNGFVVPVIVLTKINSGDLLDSLTFLHNKGLNRIMINRYNVGGVGKYRNDLTLNKAEINAAFTIANNFAEKYGMVITSNVCSPICYIDPSQFSRIAFGNCSSDVNRRPITVNILGDVRLCNHSPVVAGNIFKESFSDIFNSDYSRMWSEMKPEYCSDCVLYTKCMGGCRAAAEQMGLSLAHPDPVIELF
jgi:radical SAM protein with 4Fe4S-binding SPASM domain